MQPTIEQLIQWSHEAGQILRDGFGRQHQIQMKGSTDLVTEMDRQSEALLLERILGAFPDHTIYTEESGHLNGQSSSCWYLDPIDGTVNYAHGLPIFNVSIAYAEAGQVLLGVVYDPMRDETFSAVKGKGAYLNGTRITVAQTGQLINALLATGFPYNLDKGFKPDNLDLFTTFARRARGMRRLGSAALDICYVACGRLDGYWEPVLYPYDMAAGALIASEAGAKVTRLDGSLNLLTSPCDLVVANPRLHELMLEVIRENQK